MKSPRVFSPRSFLIIVSGASLFACGGAASAPAVAPPVAEAPAESPVATERVVVDNSTAGIAQRHFKQLEDGNLEGLLEDYHESAVVLTPAGLVKGKEALSAHWGNLVEEFSSEEASLSLGDLRVRDDMAYITWSAKTARKSYDMGTNTFVVIDGKIVAQSFAGDLPEADPVEGAAGDSDPAEATPTAEVLEHHLTALEKGEFDEVWADYTRDSLILTQKGKKSGKEGVKGVLAVLKAEFENPKQKAQIAKKIVDGEVAYVLWSLKSEGGDAGFITETLVIRDGKIASQSLTIDSPQG